MTQHTLGPWAIEKCDDTYVAISGEGWDWFAKVVVKMSDESEQSLEGLANARLISASPDLLHALELARDHLEVCNGEGEEDEALETIKAAIRKAIGQ